MGRFALDEAPERKRDALVESERRCPRAYRCSRASGVLSECVDSEGSLSSITSGSVVSAIPFASGDEGKECGGVSGMGVDDRLGSVLLTPVLQSSLSSSSHRADIRPEDLRERLLLLSPFPRPGLRAGGGRSGGGGTATWKSAGNVLGFRRFEGDDAAGMRGLATYRKCCGTWHSLRNLEYGNRCESTPDFQVACLARYCVDWWVERGWC